MRLVSRLRHLASLTPEQRERERVKRSRRLSKDKVLAENRCFCGSEGATTVAAAGWIWRRCARHADFPVSLSYRYEPGCPCPMKVAHGGVVLDCECGEHIGKPESDWYATQPSYWNQALTAGLDDVGPFPAESRDQ